MNIQTALRQWSGSTLDKAHRELGVEAAGKIDALEKALLALSRAYSDWSMNVSDEDEQLISRLLREAEEK